ncbi:MAG: glycosyltransferase family 2 protein [Oceanicaulis sp.]
MTPLIDTFANTAFEAAPGALRLSVLIPFHNDDARGLIDALHAGAPAGVEIVLFDDGAPDPELNTAVRDAVADAPIPTRLLTAKTNLGRAAARNRLAARARGDWLLFLDADMTVAPNFLGRWLDFVGAAQGDALFGGYEPAARPPRAHRLHAALARASDVATAAERSNQGAFAVCSSNLAVRAHAFAKVGFDEGYAGWGWEDVDWALSFAQRFRIDHVDHPAGHGGLETPERLIAKFSRSGANFARLMARHPEYAARKGAWLALGLKQRGLAAPARLAGRLAARAPLPMRLRVLGLKLYRAAVSAEALP